MRLLAVAALLGAACVTTNAAVTCDKIEYAQLKDSSRQELLGFYCSATSKQALNAELRAINEDLLRQQVALGADTRETRKKATQDGDAEVACAKVAASAKAMLAKRFKAGNPTCNQR